MLTWLLLAGTAAAAAVLAKSQTRVASETLQS